jgi:predicted transposase YbfD/YdcC
VDWQSTFEGVNDPRRKQGQRYSLPSILLLALAAMLCNHLSELAIAQWGAAQSEEVKKALGFERGVTPHQTTLQRLFRRLNPEEVEAAFLPLFEKGKEERGGQALSIDGKAQRGRLKFEEEESYRVHVVSIVDHQTGVVLTQGHVERGEEPEQSKQNRTTVKNQQSAKKAKKKQSRKKTQREQEEEKAKSELAVASLLVKLVDWEGKVLTGDALYCQRLLCQALLQAGGDYLFLVKANQPQLFEALRLLFETPPSAKRAGESVLYLPEQHAQTQEKGHGRLERRSIRVSSELNEYADWPGLQQVFEIRRRWRYKGVWKESIRYGVTSLPATLAIPERVLALKRGHWGIENRLHYVKDVTMGEDRSTVHKDQGPNIMAALRNTVVSLLRRAGFSTIAARLRYNSVHPEAALKVLSLALF